MIKLNSLLSDIPLPIRLFLGKALLFFVIWKALYMGFFMESKSLDHPLTTHVGNASVYVLNNWSPMSDFKAVREAKNTIYEGEKSKEIASLVYHNDKRVLYIADLCNGLELIVLYIGFIVCMPASFWRKTKYIIIGAILLDAVNIGRCVGLIYLREYYQYYFDIAHKYIFSVTVYSVTFLFWAVYTRKINLKSKNETVQV
ncbi:MAG: exosortase/archaeosortase family protein [Winogradskyella sp.]|uniref:exosortase/archaeosortase family protein n=1 Tax=Winogradskyella sp. TaxID=1883156 RepID=UPI0025DDBB5B|nr:exosortase/archaeosortase family protein [Winogradskyella sp.]NRB58676.1 exosortase/archaeosortase family protein [Winogradskyella sp.]